MCAESGNMQPGNNAAVMVEADAIKKNKEREGKKHGSPNKPTPVECGVYCCRLSSSAIKDPDPYNKSIYTCFCMGDGYIVDFPKKNTITKL